MQLQLLEIDYNSVKFDKIGSKPNLSSLDVDFKFKYDFLINDEFQTRFSIESEIKILIQDYFYLEINSVSSFECNQLIDDEFYNSDIANINAPSILFPFLRAYVANFTLQSNLIPLKLPSLNFVELWEEKRRKLIK